ncbi:FtsK/SpoIIIE domain-containing protein [Ornithinimicrobium cerasi]|uniref:FtsK/SpoIIIE domain-containing protein n=1 Tax=Ornithinimicrobium cerasi TaxID=2248773 RepID=UPI00137B5377|nr:FtsK/SpoIIIE domain-containing protein [Ornithinimicrobium cerasi]
MRIIVTTAGAGGPRTWVVRAPGATTLGQLLPRLGRGCAPDLTGRAVRHGYAVDAPGGDLAPDGPSSPTGSRPTGTTSPPGPTTLGRLVVDAGPDAGGWLALPPGRWRTVGRDPQCDLVIDDPGLSRRHLRVRHGRHGFEVEDLGSTNGVHPLDDGGGTALSPGTRLRIGGSVVRLETTDSPHATGREHDGRLVITPWPRVAPLPSATELRTPGRPARRHVQPPSAWSWALPLVAAGLAALLLRMPLLLVFGLLGPTMVLGQHLGDRRSSRVEHEVATRAWAAAAADADAQVRRAVERERKVRRDRDPGIAGVVRALVPRPTTALWARAAEAPTVVLGEGTDISLTSLDGRPVPVDEVPVTLDLSDPVVVIGPPGLRDAAVRSWILQLATSIPPGALSITVDPDEPPGGFDLLGWLPHTVPHGSPRASLTLRWGTDLILVEEVADAPPGLARVHVVGTTRGVLERPGEPPRTFRPTLVGRLRSRALARCLAGLHDGSAGTTGTVRTTMLGDLVPWPSTTCEVLSGWSSPHAQLDVPVGTAEDGRPVVLDLDRQGPHALIAGTTGSGKSELLRTLVTSLALNNPPSRLSMLLIDYKGGSSLGECARFPHSTGLVTDLDPHLADRVLTSLRAELVRRERVLGVAGVRDLRDYRGDDVGRLVVVVDEFRVLAEEIPDFVPGLVRVATVGRSLGLHLVLATQRPAGVVTSDLRANVNLRVALRVRDEADSRDVLECPDAAGLPQSEPGVALVRSGAEPPSSLRVAPVGPPTTHHDDDGWSVHEVRDVWDGWRTLHRAEGSPSTRDGLAGLPDLLSRAAADGREESPRVWLPPLPATLSRDDVLHDLPQAGGTPPAWALADRPDLQRREPMVWTGRAHVGLVGAARTGRTTALATLAGSVGQAFLYVLDPGRGLSTTFLRQHPRVLAWVQPGDRAHGLRVLEVLNDMVDERRAAPTSDRIPVVVLVDGWDRWVAEYADLDSGRGVELALRLLREGPSAQVVLALSGDRSLLTGRVAAELPEVWALRLNDQADLALAGLAGRYAAAHQPPGRAVRTRDGVVAQVVLPPHDPPADPAVDVTPEDVVPPHLVSLPARVGSATGWAVGGDLARPLPVPAGSVLVVGPPRSGVSTTLRRLLTEQGDADADARTVSVTAGAGDAADLAGQLASSSVSTVVVDDVHLLAGQALEDLILEWAGRTGGRLLVGGVLDECVNLYRGLVPQVAKRGTGVILQPSSAQHGSLLGVRPPLGDPRIPGRGVLVQRGRCTRIQVAGP